MECVEKMRAMRNVMPKDIRNDWDIICDSIEAERNMIVEAARAESAPARYFCERLEEAAKDREDVTLFGVDYMALPLDAEDKPVHVGDKLIRVQGSTDRELVITVIAVDGNSVFYMTYDEDILDVADVCVYTSSSARCFKHLGQGSITDILREFALACEDAGNAGPEVERIAAEYAKRLQLKEG